MTDAQAQRLWTAAAHVPSGGRIVEIGSYRGRSTIVLAGAAPHAAEVVAIDPHAGNDRGPRQWTGTAAEGESDHAVFLANLERARVADRVRHVRRFSQDALDGRRGRCRSALHRRRAPLPAGGARHQPLGRAGGARRRAADPRRLLLGRRDARDRPPPARRQPLPLPRAQRVAGRIPARGAARGGAREHGRPAARRAAVVRPQPGRQGRARGTISRGSHGRSATARTSWPY